MVREVVIGKLLELVVAEVAAGLATWKEES